MLLKCIKAMLRKLFDKCPRRTVVIVWASSGEVSMNKILVIGAVSYIVAAFTDSQAGNAGEPLKQAATFSTDNAAAATVEPYVDANGVTRDGTKDGVAVFKVTAVADGVANITVSAPENSALTQTTQLTVEEDDDTETVTWQDTPPA